MSCACMYYLQVCVHAFVCVCVCVCVCVVCVYVCTCVHVCDVIWCMITSLMYICHHLCSSLVLMMRY